MIRLFLKARTILFMVLLTGSLNSCVRPEDNAVKQPEIKPAPVVYEKPGPEMYSIEINGMKFNPPELTVHQGDTVTWKNNDIVAHCVTEENSKSWTSGKIEKGASWKMVVNTSANYFCSIHQVMKGKITVE